MKRSGSALIIVFIAVIFVIAVVALGAIKFHKSSSAVTTTVSPTIPEQLFYVSNGTLYDFNTATRATSTITSDVGFIMKTVWSDRYVIATNAAQNTLYLYDPKIEKLYTIAAVKAFGKNCYDPQDGVVVYPVSISPDGDDIEIGCTYNTISYLDATAVFSVKEGNLITSIFFERRPENDVWSPDGTKLAIQKAGPASASDFFDDGIDIISFIGTASTEKMIVPYNDPCSTIAGWLDNMHVVCADYSQAATAYFSVNIDTDQTTTAQEMVPQSENVLVYPTSSISGLWTLRSHACEMHQESNVVESSDGSHSISLGYIDDDCGDFVWYPIPTTAK